MQDKFDCVSVAEPAMYDLKRHKGMDALDHLEVSVAEPAMYDLKLIRYEIELIAH